MQAARSWSLHPAPLPDAPLPITIHNDTRPRAHPLQTRNISCINSLGNEAPPARCGQPAPATNRTCQEQDCESSGPQVGEGAAWLGPRRACPAVLPTRSEGG